MKDYLYFSRVKRVYHNLYMNKESKMIKAFSEKFYRFRTIGKVFEQLRVNYYESSRMKGMEEYCE